MTNKENTPFSPSLITTFRPSKSLKNNKDDSTITSIDFDDSGKWAITAASDESLQLYDCRAGKHSETLYSKKYGAHLAKFTHLSSNIVYASTKEDDTIRYLSLHDNSYVRYFKGHEGKVVSLEVNPVDDHLLSCSLDNTLRLWDLRSPVCHGLLNIKYPSIGAFDPSGSVFSVACKDLSGSLLLYDLRNFDKEPFATFKISDDQFLSTKSFPPQLPAFSKIEFTNDGKHILVGTRGDVHYVLDAFTGAIVARLINFTTPQGLQENVFGEVCLTPDGRFVLSASGEKCIRIWDLASGQSRDLSLSPFSSIACGQKVPSIVQYNHKYHLMATAYKNELRFWLPSN